jgi:exopolysaccharide biosynthesis polyprenyl glycosylphosphotransferase
MPIEEAASRMQPLAQVVSVEPARNLRSVESSAATQENAARLTRPLSVVAPAPASPRARQRSQVLSRWLAAADLVAALAAAAAGAAIAGGAGDRFTVFVLACGLLWPLLSFTVGLYADDGLRFWVSGVSQAPRTVVTTILFAWPVFALATAVGLPSAALATAVAVPVTALASGVGRAAVRSAVHRSAALRQRVVIVGSGVVAGQLIGKLRTHPEFGLVPIGLVDDEVHPVGISDMPLLGSLADLRRVIDDHAVDRVIIAFTRASHEDLLECIRAAQDKGISVDVVPRLFELLGGGRALDRVGGLPLLSIGTAQLGRISKVAKRMLDIVLASLALLVAAIPLAIIALLIKLESPGPVLFRQRRVGRNGKEFQLLKLRSMVAEADQRKDEVAHQNDATDGVMFKIHRDPRITRVGGFLRRFSIDELPQLVNVLKGDMSLVGPRPLIVPEHDALSERWHYRRVELRPGLTGAWQIYGRSESPFDEMVRFDYQYVAGWSLSRDVEILLATVPAVLSGRGAY